uniref:Odorant receptor n=1 Tax=Trichogramma kaykai TaxID=54128 RepID=A0ABD2XGI9_9HYME
MAIQTTQAELAELSRQLDFEENQFYWLKKFLKFVFLCPVQPKAIQKSGRAMMHMSFIFSIIITCTRAHKELVVNEIYPPMLAELAFQLITLLGVYFVYLQAIGSEKVLYRMCEVVTIDWLSIKDPEEKNTMKVVCEQGSRLILIHFGILLPSLLGYALAPVFLPNLLNPYLPENMTLEKTLCAHVELFIDQDKYFYHILIFLIHMVILIMLVISALDLAYTSCITYIMGKIIWIGDVFQRLGEIKTSDKSPSAKRKIDLYVHQTIIGLIKRHQKCLEFSQTLNDACSPKLIIVMVGFMIVLSLSGSMVSLIIIKNSFVV